MTGRLLAPTRHGLMALACSLGSGPGLSIVSQWEFEPALKAGRPVATRANAPVTFRINGKAKDDKKARPRALTQDRRYPAASKGDVVDDHHGTRVADPYRWLEDLRCVETKAFIEAQNEVSSKLLAEIPQREAIHRRLEELWNYSRTSLPVREAGRLFYRRNSGLEKQAPLYVRDTLEGPPRLLLDPNALSPDGSVALAQWAVSPDGKHLAYGLSPGGADWQTVHVRETATGRELDERVEWFRFSQVSWTKDGKGFFYSRYPEPPKGQELSAPLEHQKLYYHRLGTPQSEDLLVYERPDLPKHFLFGGTTEDGRYLLVYLFEGTSPKNRLYYADLQDPLSPKLDAPIVKIVDEHIAEFRVLGNVGPVFYTRTDLAAPNRRVIAIDPRLRIGRAGWKTIVPERPQPMEGAALVGGKLFAQYLVDVKSQLERFSLDGTSEGSLALPGLGTATGLSGREDDDELFYAFTSFLAPTTVYRYDVKTQAQAPFEPPAIVFDASSYETTQTFVTSKDGTKVPMFLTARKGLRRDGRNPVWMYAYGGFASSVLPAYKQWVPAWLEMGGIFAQPSLRGGGEYGERWHEAGMKERKQSVFDDFIAAAEYLVREKYTSPKHLVIEGGSNGGLLVGAVMTQRPDLYAVALPAVGVMDMLRFHKFTGGAAWTTEYGSADDPEDFRYLSRYSPLQSLKPGTCYPATFVTTADHDDRVVPSHSYKFTAALQSAQGCDKPVILRVETKGSHGYSPTDKLIAERADLMAFVAGQLGLKVRAPGVAADETVFRPPARRADALKVLLVTGGHDHDVVFYSAFDGQDDLAVTVDGHPSAFARPFGKTGRRVDVDVLALYDMPPDVPEAQRENVRRYVEEGGAVVGIHHALSGSTGWAWLHEEVLGARWIFTPEPGRPASEYKHDEEITVKVVADHPITKGLADFRIHDETYGKLWMSPRLQVLLRTDHPLSDGPVAWTLPHPKARLAVIQLGHGREAHLNPSWRRLVRNALLWAGGRD